MALDGKAEIVRDAAQRAGGHATLIRAPADRRGTVPACHAPRPGIAALGAIGISGDTPDNDEACTQAGIEAAGLRPQL